MQERYIFGICDVKIMEKCEKIKLWEFGNKIPH